MGTGQNCQTAWRARHRGLSRARYLPEALRNYLLRLGWSHGDDEIISTEEAIEWFDIDAVGRAPARFDFAKLDNLNGHYIRAAEDDRLVALVAPRLEMLVGKPLTDIELGRLRGHDRAQAAPKTLAELAANARFLVAVRPIRLDEKAAKLLTPDARRLLADLIDRLRAAEWQPERLEEEIRSFADQKGTKLGSVAQPLRAALTGSVASPGIFVVMKILGRDESLARIADAAGSAG